MDKGSEQSYCDEECKESEELQDRFSTNIPLIDRVPFWAGKSAGKVIQHHASDAGRAVILGRAEAVSAAAVTYTAGVGVIVGISGRRTDHPAIARTEIAVVVAGCALTRADS